MEGMLAGKFSSKLEILTVRSRLSEQISRAPESGGLRRALTLGPNNQSWTPK